MPDARFKRRRALVTRPEPDGGRLAAILGSQGIDALVEPLMTIVPIDAELPDLSNYAGLLFTSANGVRAFADRSADRTLPVYAVGAATGAAAHALGFTQVTSSDGDVAALTETVATSRDPAVGALLHLSGKDAAGDLAGALQARGFTVDRVVLYDAQPAESLSTRTISAIRANTLDCVLLFSPRTARLFVELVEAADIGAWLTGVRALCLSPAVADALPVHLGLEIEVASQPDQAALLALV